MSPDPTVYILIGPLPLGYVWKIKSIIFEHMLRVKFMNTCENALWWEPQNIFDGKSP